MIQIVLLLCAFYFKSSVMCVDTSQFLPYRTLHSNQSYVNTIAFHKSLKVKNELKCGMRCFLDKACHGFNFHTLVLDNEDNCELLNNKTLGRNLDIKEGSDYYRKKGLCTDYDEPCDIGTDICTDSTEMFPNFPICVCNQWPVKCGKDCAEDGYDLQYMFLWPSGAGQTSSGTSSYDDAVKACAEEICEAFTWDTGTSRWKTFQKRPAALISPGPTLYELRTYNGLCGKPVGKPLPIEPTTEEYEYDYDDLVIEPR